MLIQELLSSIIGASFPLGCDLLLLQIVAVGALKNPSYETVWEMANRVCDRYLPWHSRGDSAFA